MYSRVPHGSTPRTESPNASSQSLVPHQSENPPHSKNDSSLTFENPFDPPHHSRTDSHPSMSSSTTAMSYPPTVDSHVPIAHPAHPHLGRFQSLRQRFRPRNLRERFSGKGKNIPGIFESIGRLAVSSWLNWFIVCVPLSWVAHFLNWDNNAVFFLSLFGLVFLEKMMDYLGEELAMYCGHALGDLIFVSLHNTVEAALAVILLRKCQLRMVQSTVIGVVLLHILFVPGVAFLTGGSKMFQQLLLERPTQLNHTLMTVGVLTILVPAAIFAILNETPIPDAAFAEAVNAYDLGKSEAVHAGSDSHSSASVHDIVHATVTAVTGAATATATSTDAPDTDHGGDHRRMVMSMIKRAAVSPKTLEQGPWTPLTDATRGSFLALSRGFAIILLIIYITSRIYLHNPPKLKTDVESSHKRTGTLDAATVRSEIDLRIEKERIEEIESHQHKINPWVCIFFLIICVGLMAVTSEWLISAVLEIADKRNITTEWLGLIVLPISSFLGDALVAIVFFARTALGLRPHPLRSLAKGRDIDSSIQFMVMWLPLLILIAWGIGHPLSMLFDLYEVAVLVGASFLVNSVTQDHKTNWAEGVMMIGFYVIIALSAWFYHGQVSHSHMLTCTGTVIESIEAGSDFGFAQNIMGRPN